MDFIENIYESNVIDEYDFVDLVYGPSKQTCCLRVVYKSLLLLYILIELIAEQQKNNFGFMQLYLCLYD